MAWLAPASSGSRLVTAVRTQRPLTCGCSNQRRRSGGRRRQCDVASTSTGCAAGALLQRLLEHRPHVRQHDDGLLVRRAVVPAVHRRSGRARARRRTPAISARGLGPPKGASRCKPRMQVLIAAAVYHAYFGSSVKELSWALEVGTCRNLAVEVIDCIFIMVSLTGLYSEFHSGCKLPGSMQGRGQDQGHGQVHSKEARPGLEWD